MHDARITIPAAAGPPAPGLRDARPRGRRLLALAAGLVSALCAAAPAHATLTGAGPVVPRHGFPEWYQDESGLRLTLCVENEDPFCSNTAPEPGPATVSQDPAQSNFPDETFWWSAEALITAGDTRARLVLAQEAAFANETVTAGDQVSFGRIRVRLDGVRPNARYRVTHPYGTEQITADSRGRARLTDDVGCDATPCDFRDALATRIGPFLRWDPNVPPAAPAGYVGNPLREHRVVGSPRGAAGNVFRVTGPDVGGPGDDSIETRLFTVEGKAATTQGTPTAPPPGGGTTPPPPGGGTPPPGGGTPPPPPGGGTPPPSPGTPPAPRPPAPRPPLVPSLPNLPGLPPLPPLFAILGR
jgi:hypothetical protein